MKSGPRVALPVCLLLFGQIVCLLPAFAADKTAAKPKSLQPANSETIKPRTPSVSKTGNAAVKTQGSSAEKAAAMASVIFPFANENSASARQLEQQIKSMLSTKDYDGLEKMADGMLASKSENSNGYWKLDQFHRAFGYNFSFMSTQEKLKELDRVYAWILARPKSLTARIVYAGLQISYAWDARGSGWSNSVTPKGWALFFSRLNTAATTLRDARQTGKDSPVWYEKMLIIARARSLPREYCEMLVKQAREKYPTYKYTVYERCLDLDPRWGGSPGEMERYLEAEADLRGGSTISGDLFYAQIVGCIEAMHMYKGSEFFPNLQFSWKRTKSGFHEIMRRYPNNIAAASQFCRLACIAGDFETARPLFARLKGRADPKTWIDATSFVRWRDTAFKGI